MIVSKIPALIKKYNLHFLSLFLIIVCISLSNYFTNFKKKQSLDFQKFLENTYLNKTSFSLIQNLDPRFEKIIIKVKSGDSFQKILSQIEIDKSEKNRILKEILKKKKKVSNLVKGQKIIFKIDKREYKKIIELLIEVSKTKSIIFALNTNTNNFEYKEIQKSLKRNKPHPQTTWEITNERSAERTFTWRTLAFFPIHPSRFIGARKKNRLQNQKSRKDRWCVLVLWKTYTRSSPKNNEIRRSDQGA